MNLWQIITGNSSLPVQSGNNLWDHINSQKSGSLLTGGFGIKTKIKQNTITVSLQESDYIITVNHQASTTKIIDNEPETKIINQQSTQKTGCKKII